MVLVFDIAGDMALFRKPYTTTSMVSFPFPPPTAVAGMIGAIIGIDHKAFEDARSAAFWNEMRGMQIAIGLRNPVDWMITAVNLMKFKSTNASMKEHIQVKHQFVKNPCYRVYVRGSGLYGQLKERLERGRFTFTPYLGVAYALAEINYIGEFPEEELADESAAVDTIVPFYEGVELDIISSKGVHRETVPFRITTERRQQETVMVFYPEFNRKMKDRPRLFLKNNGNLRISRVSNERVAWFDEW